MAPHRLVFIGPCMVFVGLEARTGPRCMAKREPTKALQSGSCQARRRTSTGLVRLYAQAPCMMHATIDVASICRFQTETGFFHFFNSLRGARSQSQASYLNRTSGLRCTGPMCDVWCCRDGRGKRLFHSRPEKQESASDPHHLASALGMDIIASWHHTDSSP